MGDDWEEEDLCDAVRAAFVEKPGIGVKPLVKHIVSAHGWNVDSKAVRDAISAIASSKYVPAGRAGEAAIARAERSAEEVAAALKATKVTAVKSTLSAAHEQRLQDILS